MSEAPGLTRVPVGNDLGRGHCAGLGKKSAQLFFGRFVGQIAYVQFAAHTLSLLVMPLSTCRSLLLAGLFCRDF